MEIQNFWWRRVTANDFYNIEKPLPPGPKGQEHIDIPSPSKLLEFMGDDPATPSSSWTPYSVNAFVLLDPSIQATISFQDRASNNRYHIKRQNINSDASERHPAWTTRFGWPEHDFEISSTLVARQVIVNGLIIFVASGIDGNFYAGCIPNISQISDINRVFAELQSVQSAGLIKNLGKKSTTELYRMMGLDPTEADVASGDINLGDVRGIAKGFVFESKSEIVSLGLHGSAEDFVSIVENGPALSIIISPKFSEIKDKNSEIILTFSVLDSGIPNAVVDKVKSERVQKAILYSYENELPIRVIREKFGDVEKGTSSVYTYGGTYTVTGHWYSGESESKSTLNFILNEDVEPLFESIETKAARTIPVGVVAPARRTSVANSIKRDLRVSEWVKSIHNHTCQVCGQFLTTPGGRYSEGAHIRPLGEDHSGQDVVGNILCLCPNCHKLFDAGAFFIDPDTQQIFYFNSDQVGQLVVHEDHLIDRDVLAYRRERIAYHVRPRA